MRYVEHAARYDVDEGAGLGGLEFVDEVGAGFPDGPGALPDALAGSGGAVVGDADDGYATGPNVLESGSRGTGEGVDTGERGQKVSLVGQSRLPSRVRIIAWGMWEETCGRTVCVPRPV